MGNLCLPMIRLALTIDYAFKKFFIGNPDLLVDFLNALFHEYNAFSIESATVLNPELPGEAIDDKNAILDILAEDSAGRKINIEMQAHEIAEFAKRAAFYAFRLYVSGIEKGHNHAEIPPVYSINLLDLNLFPGYSYHRCFRLLDVAEPQIALMEDMEFHFIELGKLSGKPESLNALESWLEFIRHSDTLSGEQMEKLEKQNPAMEKARKALDEISMDSDTRLQYDRRKSAIFFYERTLDKKFADGMAEGKQEGLLEGKQEGLREGELKGKLESARRMLDEGFKVDEILRITGLSEDDLRQAGLVQ